MSQANVRSVGEFFVDAQGRASGQNLLTSIDEAAGTIRGFQALALGTEIFSSIKVSGFSQAEKIQGVGSSALTLRGSNAVVSLHDNINSAIVIAANAQTLVTYRLSPDVSATQEGAHGGVVRITHGAKGYIGSLVAYGSEGPRSLGDAITLKAGEVHARVQSGSQLVFLAKPVYQDEAEFHQALVRAAAEGALASHYVTEFEGSDIRTSQVDLAPGARTTPHAGMLSTNLRGPARPSIVAYDLAYETLPARSAADVAVFVNGELAARADSPGALVASARSGISQYYALVESGRTQLLAAVPSGEQRIVISASASASTESQAQAESSGDESSRVYGGFEYHANGKLTGDFLTSVVPDGRAKLLSYTTLASRIEVFRSVTIDDGASASFHETGTKDMRIQTPKADLVLVDDIHTTTLVVAKAPTDVAYELAPDVRARAERHDVLALESPSGLAGHLILIGDGSLAVEGANVLARLSHGATVLFRGAPDAHANEPAIARAIADGSVGAQLLAGVHAGRIATRALSYTDDAEANIRSGGHGQILVDYATNGAAPPAIVLDARGASIAVKSASDVRVSIDGTPASPAASAEDALDALGIPRYHASTSPDGALRVIVNTAATAGRTVSVSISSAVETAARARVGTDAFGAFRVFHDGTAVGDFVTLRADRAAGAVSGVTMLATGQPLFASITAGESPFASVSGDGASVLRLENRGSRMEFSDSTSGFAKFVALRDTSAAFRLAAGLHAQAAGPGVIEILDATHAHVGSLVLTGTTGASTLAHRGEGEVRARLTHGAEIIFRTHAGIESELSAAQRTMINQAIATGHVAGQVIVQTQANLEADAHALEQTARTESEGLAVAARRAYGEVTSAVSASYGDVQVLTAATKQRVDITVASSSKIGKTLIVSLDPDTIPGMAQGRATIKFDGEIVGQASSYADILDANDDDGLAEYFVLAGDAGTQVLVSIPSFSVHTVTLEQQPQESGSMYMYATLFLGLLVVVESALLARGRLAKNHTITTRRP